MAVDWGLLQPQPAVADTYLKGFTQGQAIAKDQAVRSAFAKVGTDPAGAQADLLRVGAIPEASALANLQYQQAQRALLGAAYAKLGIGPSVPNAITGQPAAPTTAQPAADPMMDAGATPGSVAHPAVGPDGQPAAAGQVPQDIPHPSDLNPDQAAHALEMSHAFDALGMEVAGLPYDQRRARIAAEKPQLLAKGVPEAAIDGFDPTDANIATIHSEMAQLRGMLPPTASVTPGQAGQGAPVAAAPAPSTPVQPTPAPGAAGGGFNLMDPTTQQGLQALSIADPQAAGPLIALGSAVAPKFTAGRPGAIIYDEKTGLPKTSTPNAQGIVIDFAPDGSIAGSHVVPHYAESAAAFEGGVAGATANAKVPAAVTEAAQKQDITDRSTRVEIPNSDGSSTVGTMYDYKHGLGPFSAGGAAPAPAGAPAPAAGAGGAPAATTAVPALGRSQGTGEAQYAKDDASAFSKTVATAGDPQTMIGYQNAATTAHQAVLAAMSINPNEWTPGAKKVADIGNAIHAATGLPIPGEKQANDLSYYASLIPQVTRTTFKTFPRLEKEFETVKAAIPGLKTPRDAAALTFASIEATNNRNAQFSQFVANYTGPHSQDALNKAWAASPQAKASIFADPAYRNLTMDGKPAVYINPTPHNGHVYGVFRPGTPNAQTFLVR